MKAPAPGTARLTTARAAAWTLLLSGWVGLGAFAQVLAPSVAAAFALVALLLLALGVAAVVGTRDNLRAGVRRAALLLFAAVGAAALVASVRGGGLAALLLALLAWAALTALASGVVRRLRFAAAARPGPPIGAASLGALCAAIALGDVGDLPALALRLGLLVMLAAVGLAALQPADAPGASGNRCRAGLFDCSLPAWPAGAWNDPRQWPALLAGLAMLPMMAALPLMVAWCRVDAIAPQTMVLLHLGAMFAPALLFRRTIGAWSVRVLATVCAGCLAVGALFVLFAPSPWHLLGVAVAHGAAWGLAWAGQLWSPDRRGRQGASPLRASIGYAVLTLAFGVLVDRYGAAGVGAAHATLGALAVLAWIGGSWLRPSDPPAEHRPLPR